MRTERGLRRAERLKRSEQRRFHRSPEACHARAIGGPPIGDASPSGRMNRGALFLHPGWVVQTVTSNENAFQQMTTSVN